MLSKITSKYQTTIPKAIREKFKLLIPDIIWKIKNNRCVIYLNKNPFLKYEGRIKTGKGNIKQDIKKARKKIVIKYS